MQLHVLGQAETASDLAGQVGDAARADLRHALADGGGEREALRHAHRLGLFRDQVLRRQARGEARLVATASLGRVERAVGRVDQLGRARDAVARPGGPGGCGDVQAGDDVGADRRPQGLGAPQEVVLVAGRGQHDRELLAAPAGDEAVPAYGPQAAPGLHQHAVADAVAVRSLMRLKWSMSSSTSPTPLGVRGRPSRSHGEVAAVGEAGQRVGAGLLLRDAARLLQMGVGAVERDHRDRHAGRRAPPAPRPASPTARTPTSTACETTRIDTIRAPKAAGATAGRAPGAERGPRR